MNKENRIDSHLKSILKGITWRITATLATILIAYIITGDISDAIKIGGIEFFGKLILYYFHERIWIAFSNLKHSKSFS